MRIIWWGHHVSELCHAEISMPCICFYLPHAYLWPHKIYRVYYICSCVIHSQKGLTSAYAFLSDGRWDSHCLLDSDMKCSSFSEGLGFGLISMPYAGHEKDVGQSQAPDGLMGEFEWECFPRGLRWNEFVSITHLVSNAQSASRMIGWHWLRGRFLPLSLLIWFLSAAGFGASWELSFAAKHLIIKSPFLLP